MHSRILLLLATITILACSPNNQYKLSFCEAIEQQVCVGEDSVFAFGTRVFVQFSAPKPFPQDTIVGKVYGILTEPAGERFMVAQREFLIGEDQSLIEHYIPFEDFNSIGKYEIEFSDKAGSVLTTGKMRILAPDSSQ